MRAPERLSIMRRHGRLWSHVPGATVLGIACLAVATVFSLPAQSETHSRSAKTPFLYFQRCVYANLLVNERLEVLFLVDTGANRSSVDPSLISELHLPETATSSVEGTGGVIKVRGAKLATLRLGEIVKKNLDLTAQDLSGLASPNGKKVKGILGLDFLHGLSLGFDFVHQLLTLREGATAAPMHAAVLPFELDNGIPRIEAVLNGVPVKLRVDTGASIFDTPDVYINIPSSAWKVLTDKNSDLRPEKYFSGSGTGGSFKLAVAEIKNAEIGGSAIQARIFVIVQPERGYFARSDAVGFISNNLLEKYGNVILDYVAQRIYLGPAR